MAYDYDQYVTELTDLMVVAPTDPSFVDILPAIIDYAEQRIYRELDLLSTLFNDGTGTLTVNRRFFTFPRHFVTCQDIAVITPVGATTPTDPGFTLVPLTIVTKEWITNVYPSPTTTGVPRYFSMFDDQTIFVGPWPDDTYNVLVTGTIRPDPLSASNTTTYLTTYLPDLFLAASMIYASAYKQNFGQSSDNPQMAQSWETQYKQLMASASVEELRKRWQSGGWTSQSPSPLAEPTTRR